MTKKKKTTKQYKIRKLNDQQKLFAAEMLIDGNRTQAAIRAGYSAKTAKSQGSKLMTNAHILKLVEEGKAARMAVVKIDAEYVLRQSVKLHERCMSEVSPVMKRVGKDMVQDTDDDGNLLFKFDSGGAAKGLELIGKHVAIQSFNEKKSVSLDLDNATREELEAELAALKRDDDD